MGGGVAVVSFSEMAARHHGRRGPPDRRVTGVTSDVACSEKARG